MGTHCAMFESMPDPRIQLQVTTGQRFGRLTVLSETRTPPTPRDIEDGRNGKRAALCRCDCGNEKIITLKALYAKAPTVSCGCFHREQAATQIGDRSRTHGMSRTREYEQCLQRIERCYNPNHPRYNDYGGRGITVWSPWRDNPSSFVNWLLDNLGPRPTGFTLDRINNSGNYEPGNLRWADYRVQGQNSRHTKLSPESIREIRERYARGDITQTELGTEYNVHQATISSVVREATWNNVELPETNTPDDWTWL